jgi:hypothetical protein
MRKWWIAWIAIFISAAITVFVSFQIADMNVLRIVGLFMFFFFSAYVIVEMLNLLLGIRFIDDFRASARFLFRSVEDSPGGIFNQESLISVKGEAAFKAWSHFLLSLMCLGLSLYFLFSKFSEV